MVETTALAYEATYVWVGENPLTYIDNTPPKKFHAGDELPRERAADAWDHSSENIAVLDEDGDLVDDVGAGNRNPDRAVDVLDDRDHDDS